MTYSLRRRCSASGRFYTEKIPESSAADLAKAKPSEIWQTGDGRQILPKDMETRHLINCIKILLARIEPTAKAAGMTIEQTAKLCEQQHPIFKVMAEELKARMMPAGKQQEQPSRKFDLEE